MPDRHRQQQHCSFLRKVVFALTALMAGMSIAVTPAVAQELPVAPEKKPPGDIPDTQVFITFTSPLGFSLKVPEG
jgi:hypothetical protein